MTARTWVRNRVMTRGLATALPLLAATALTAPGSAQTIIKQRPETVEAYERYVNAVESQIQQNLDGKKPFLVMDNQPRGRTKVQRGEIVLRPYDEEIEVPEGLVHDWYGGIFIPDVTAQQVLGVLQDYDRYKDVYEEVVDSKLLEKEGNVYRSYLRFEKNTVLRVVLNSEHEATFTQIGENRWYVRSVSTKVTEVRHPGTPKEKELPVGQDSGFLWRMNTYWALEEADGGVYAEMGTLSLTRGIPYGLGWLVRPYAKSIPRGTMEGMLQATRLAAKGYDPEK